MKKVLHHAVDIPGYATIVPRFFNEKKRVDSFEGITQGVIK